MTYCHLRCRDQVGSIR